MEEPLAPIASLEAQARVTVTNTGEGTIIWRIWGDGPPLLLLHGGHGSWKHWIRNIPALMGTYTVYVPNLPGMGNSDAVGETIEEIAAALAAGFDHLNGSTPYFLAGFSFGSVVAAYMLETHGKLIRHLCLVGTAGMGKVDMITNSLKRWQEVPSASERRAIHAHNLSQLMLYRPDSVDELAIEIQMDNAEHTVVNNRKAAMSANMAECLRHHPDLPITAIWGSEDVLVRRHLAERIEHLTSRRPPARIEVVEGVGHWVQFEAADAVNEIMLNSLESLA